MTKWENLHDHIGKTGDQMGKPTWPYWQNRWPNGKAYMTILAKPVTKWESVHDHIGVTKWETMLDHIGAHIGEWPNWIATMTILGSNHDHIGNDHIGVNLGIYDHITRHSDHIGGQYSQVAHMKFLLDAVELYCGWPNWDHDHIGFQYGHDSSTVKWAYTNYCLYVDCMPVLGCTWLVPRYGGNQHTLADKS